MSTPLVTPDLSTATVDDAVSVITKSAEPFIPAGVRATIYTVCGVIAVVGVAVGRVVGGTLGGVLESIAAAAGAAEATLALSHITTTSGNGGK